MSEKLTWTRREFIKAGLISSASLLLAACGAGRDETPPQTAELLSPAALTAPALPSLTPTPACADDDDPTPSQTAGPFYTPDTPQKANFRADGAGTALLLTGLVLDTNCRPIPGALLDFWHADDSGAYDNVGYRFRGHQFADENGRYQLETILPGLYPGRTRHFHVRVQPPNGSILTTQLYFAGEAQNRRDGFYRADLEAAEAGMIDDVRQLSFDFVLAVSGV